MSTHTYWIPEHAGWTGRLYGGVLIGGAVTAAASTVDADRLPHAVSVTCHQPGRNEVGTNAEIEVVRDGVSFSTRNVRMTQGSRLVATATVSFQVPGLGLIAHSPEPPTAPRPDEVPGVEAMFADDPDSLAWARWMGPALGIEARFPAPPVRVSGSHGIRTEPRQSVWVRRTVPSGATPADHAAVLAYLSDILLLSTALGPHGLTFQEPRLQFATLGHNVWFHRPVDVYRWLLYSQESRWAGGDRALCHGEFWDEEGHLVATTMQEGLIRLLPAVTI